MNPLGFHTLSINYGDSILAENILKPIDPIVKTRAGIEGGFNLWIRMLEDYDQLGDEAMVRRLLTPVRKNPEYLLKLEPGVRLYLSTFAFRAKDTFSLFRMLDSVFRTQSGYVVDSTLKLFYPLKFVEHIVEGAKRVNPLLVAALIRQESAFQENARSRVGAVGLMQLMPATARLMDRSVKRSQLIQPDINIRLGIRYFEVLVDRYDGDVELALAAYNAGAEVVDRWQKRYPTRNRLLFLDLMPYAETRNYVTLIGRNYYWYSKIYGETVKAVAGSADAARSEFRGLKPE
jgi:soluble lytic murein transglycosylase